MEKDAAVDTIHNPPSKRSKTMASESRRSEEGPSENVTLASTVANGTNNNENKKKEQQQQASRHLPSMIVFDLDDCLWTPEMHELPGTPELPVYGDLTPTSQNGRDDSSTAAASSAMNGVIGMQVPSHSSSRRRRGGRSRNDVTVTLHDGARQVLYELATNPIYKDIVLATASSSLEPSYSYTCLDGIEILPNTTIANLMRYVTNNFLVTTNSEAYEIEGRKKVERNRQHTKTKKTFENGRTASIFF